MLKKDEVINYLGKFLEYWIDEVQDLPKESEKYNKELKKIGLYLTVKLRLQGKINRKDDVQLIKDINEQIDYLQNRIDNEKDQEKENQLSWFKDILIFSKKYIKGDSDE